MIDAVDLLFVQQFADLAVELTGGVQIPAKRFFDDDAPPTRVFLDETRLPQLTDDGAEEVGSGRQIIKIVSAGSVLFIDPRQQRLQLVVRRRIVEITLHVTNAPR